MEFPKNFLWGTAASAYQIEGRDTNDGKGDHIWNIGSYLRKSDR